ncbi:MAG TPA: TonB C-terminal domain-containing protein [Candidatus Obscuribacterales bacterium]
MKVSVRLLLSFAWLTGCLLCAAQLGSAAALAEPTASTQQAASPGPGGPTQSAMIAGRQNKPQPTNAGTPAPPPINVDDMTPMPEALRHQLIMQEPKLDLAPPVVAPPPTQGKPMKLTAGIEEKNLAIEWDDWHNKVANAVLPHIFGNVVDSINVAAGASTMVHFVVTNDRKITSVQVVKSSGNLQYDRAVRDAVYKIDGNYVLKFPAESKRTEVATNVAFSKGGGQKNYIIFGDVEYSEMDGAGTPQAAASPAAQNAGDSESAKKRHRLW